MKDPTKKIRKWNLEELLPLNYEIADSRRKTLPSGIIKSFSNLLSRDVYSEGDAQFFYDYALSRHPEFSADFLNFLKCWLADELQHYEAMRRVYRCVAGISYEEMDRCMEQRKPNIEPIKLVLQDEFTILVTFMFDELGSVYSYRRDLDQYYKHFGKKIQKVAHHLVKDEGSHFNSAAELLLKKYSDRLSEIPTFLEKISALESSLDTYYKTFFLDHAQEKYRFPPQFNRVLIRVILARLGLGTKPKQNEVRELWQWIPQTDKSLAQAFLNKNESIQYGNSMVG